jgi:U3 small nucleolar ribonucleoprotein protein LCP5
MAVPGNSLHSLLSSLITSLQSATDSVPDPERLQPTSDAQSLLTIKNEIFLSYLENLVFLIVIKLRHFGISAGSAGGDSESLAQLHQEVAEKLVELRLYLDKGIKPLESRLTYQLDRVIRAAEEASRPTAKPNSRGRKRANGKITHGQNSSFEESSADDSGSGSGDESSGSSAEHKRQDALRPGRMVAPKPFQQNNGSSGKPGIYKPPRLNATAYPLHTTEQSQARTKSTKRGKSSTLDEFVDNELLTTPLLMPSIGSTIRDGGRLDMTRRERQEDGERTRYEEENMIRLPALSKKEMKKQQRGGTRGGFGGEDWIGLNGAVDRIYSLTKKKDGGQLERSRKRGAGLDLNGVGGGIGDRFAKRKRML